MFISVSVRGAMLQYQCVGRRCEGDGPRRLVADEDSDRHDVLGGGAHDRNCKLFPRLRTDGDSDLQNHAIEIVILEEGGYMSGVQGDFEKRLWPVGLWT